MVELVLTDLKHIIIQILEVTQPTQEHKNVIIVTKLWLRIRRRTRVTQMVCVTNVDTLVRTPLRLVRKRAAQLNTI